MFTILRRQLTATMKFPGLGAMVACAIACSASATSAASFNCRYAKSPDEVLVCQDSTLSDMDEQMSAAYASRRKEFHGADLKRFENMRYQWLSRRKSCGYDAGCIKRVYRGWTAAIENFY